MNAAYALKKIKRTMRKFIVNSISYMNRVHSNQVFFSSFTGTYSDNTKAISEALHNLVPDITIVWALKNNNGPNDNQIPDYVKVINQDSVYQFYKAVSSSKVWVSNYSFPYIRKKKEQFFVQTWHGDKAFKVILKDACKPGEDRFVSESIDGYCDLAIAGSDYGEKQYRSAFLYKGKILKVGTPRNDILVRNSENQKKQVRTKLGLTNEKVLIFAPTFRNEFQLKHTSQKIEHIDIPRILKLLEKKTGERWICLLRAHPSMAGLSGVDQNKSIVNATGYPDMAELLLASDMLVTDYSSCAGDFALLHRPIVLFQNDRADYIKNDRAFYFNMDESPYIIAQNQAEFEDIIEHHTKKDFEKNCIDILDFYGDHESGNASRAVAEIIAKNIGKTYI